MSKHTPVPRTMDDKIWERGDFEHTPTGYNVEVSCGESIVAIVNCDEGDETNLNLILASHELLASIRDIVELADFPDTDGAMDLGERLINIGNIVSNAIAVVAKAEKKE